MTFIKNLHLVFKDYYSSGIASTGLGSTGWVKSILAGETGIVGIVAGTGIEIMNGLFEWEAEFLCYSVREPFPSNTTGVSVVFGRITQKPP